MTAEHPVGESFQASDSFAADLEVARAEAEEAKFDHRAYLDEIRSINSPAGIRRTAEASVHGNEASEMAKKMLVELEESFPEGMYENDRNVVIRTFLYGASEIGATSTSRQDRRRFGDMEAGEQRQLLKQLFQDSLAYLNIARSNGLNFNDAIRNIAYASPEKAEEDMSAHPELRLNSRTSASGNLLKLEKTLGV